MALRMGTALCFCLCRWVAIWPLVSITQRKREIASDGVCVYVLHTDSRMGMHPNDYCGGRGAQ